MGIKRNTSGGFSKQKTIKMKRFRWIIRFIGDIFLTFTVILLQYITNFNSKFVFMITGMLVVWISWHFSDFINSRKRIWQTQ